MWTSLGLGTSWTDDAYAKLYGEQYGFTPAIGVKIDSEVVSENCYKQLCGNVSGTTGNAEANNGLEGTLWIYTLGWDPTLANTRPVLPSSSWPSPTDPNAGKWAQANRAKCRDNWDYGGTFGYQRWGYAWLVNRRVLYNGGEIKVGSDMLDETDGYQRPEGIAEMFTTATTAYNYPTAPIVPVDYARANYRFYHKLADRPSIVQAGRRAGFAFHAEPYESPHDGNTAGKVNLVAKYGRNSTTGSSENLIIGDGASPRGTSNLYPLVLTTIRCVEHFQGGPITRNNGLNHEVEPEPWIEINSVDARALGIVDGQKVRVVTARGDSDAGSTRMPVPPTSPGGFGGKNYTARVGSGISSGQRVGPGVVAIPWHWGEKGLSTGSRANDLTIDAYDANTQIPEYKACLCRIEPA